MRLLRLASAAALVSISSAANAYAGAVMHIDGGTAYLFSNEVHPISSPSITVEENGSGQPALANPLLLIIGVPNTTSYTAPSLTLSQGTSDLGGPGSGTTSLFGGSFNASSGRATANGGLFNGGEVYSFIGLTGGDNSNSFVNWSAWDSQVNGITASGFGIYVYELTGTGMKGAKTITATFNGSLPVGTFVVAYGQDSKGNAFSTPFTEAGLGTGVKISEAPVPEPASLLLLGTGLTALAARRRRRQAAAR